MLHRQDDEFPNLTSAQQAEALRIAARLQEEEAESRAFLAAAEEAGIERRFLNAALAQMTTPKTSVARSEWPVRAMAALLFCGGMAFWSLTIFAAPIVLAVGLWLGHTLARSGRRLWTTPTLVLVAWGLMSLAFALYSQLSTGNTGMIDGRFFLWAASHQAAFAFLGGVLVRAARVRAHRPQS